MNLEMTTASVYVSVIVQLRRRIPSLVSGEPSCDLNYQIAETSRRTSQWQSRGQTYLRVMQGADADIIQHHANHGFGRSAFEQTNAISVLSA